MKQHDSSAVVVIDPADIQKPDLTVGPYGNRDELRAFAGRLRAMLPGGNKLTVEAALALAQYALARDANPFVGEVWGWIDKNDKLILMDGYKLVTRWIENNDPENMTIYDEVEPNQSSNVEPGDFAYYCYYVRGNRRSLIDASMASGHAYDDAVRIIGNRAIGIVKKHETTKRNPPQGWDWEQVARKRAFMNAAKMSVGAPSPMEIVQNRETARTAGDWNVALDELGDNPHALPPETLGTLADMAAEYRQSKDKITAMSPDEREEMLERNRTILRGTPSELDDDLVTQSRRGNATVVDAESVEGETGNGTDAESIRKELLQAANWVRPAKKSWSDAVRQPDDEQTPPEKRDVQRLAVIVGAALRQPSEAEKAVNLKRYSVHGYVYGVQKGSHMTSDEVTAMLARWESELESWHPSEDAKREINLLYNAALEQAGQQQLPGVSDE